MDEIFVLLKKNAHAETFPKLEALMSKDHTFVIFFVYNSHGNVLGDVHADDIVCVHEDCFVADDELLQLGIVVFVSVTQDVHVWITNIEFVLPSDQEVILLGIILIKFNDKETKFVFKLVSADVKILIFLIVNNHLN